jgi:hypothetical protein
MKNMRTEVSLSQESTTRRYSLCPGTDIDTIKEAIAADGSMVVVQLTYDKVVVVHDPRIEAIYERGLCKWVLTSTAKDANVRIVFIKNAQNWRVSLMRGIKPINAEDAPQ